MFQTTTRFHTFPAAACSGDGARPFDVKLGMVHAVRRT